MTITTRRHVEDSHELIGKKENSLEVELAVTEVEQILERWAEKIDDHGVVVGFGTEPADKGDANAAGESLVYLGLIFKLRMLRLDRFELDCDFLARNYVDPKVNITCRASWASRTMFAQ